ncbi:MAG: FAD-dependent oxidoreductase, partial [Pseudoxanthomonas sp.]
MTIQTIKLLGHEEIASGTMAFHFEKPDGFTYKPGQFCDLTLNDPPETDAEGNTRAFTLASAPYESDLIVATRIRDTAFKRVLKAMKPGAELKLDAPYGSFTLHSDASIPAVFLSGGIGVTPIRSIVLQATRDKLAHRIVLFYANRTLESTAFLDELSRAQKDNPNFLLVGTMTDMERPSAAWSGETGYITSAMLRKSAADLERPIFYLSGPRAMVAAMRKVLDDAGVKDDRIRT